MSLDTAPTPLTAVSLLLVDDEPRNLDVLESILDRPDYHLQRATSAEGALRLLLDGNFAAIVLDIQMPEMNGIELAQLIKQRKRTREIPIIFLTAYYQDDTHVLEGYDTGAVDYLTKPIDPRILKSKIAVFVDLYRKNDALTQAKAELEQRVQERTAELTRANEELRHRRDALAQSEARVQIELGEQRRIEAELRSRENQLRLVTDHASVYIAQCDRQHRIRFVNRPYAARYGREPDELVGLHIGEIIGDESYHLLRPYLDTALAGERVAFEIELPGVDGRPPRWVYALHEPERNGQDEVIGLVAVISDITARKNAEQAVAAARDNALAASRAKDQFLARLSHELRTPLNPALLLATQRAGDDSLTENARNDFRTIADHVALEARLIDDLLDLTRIASGKLVVQRQPVSLNTLVRESLALAADPITAKGIAVTVDLFAKHDHALGDEVRLKQVFWNIVNNAVKFTPEGGALALRSTLVDDDRWRIEFSDTGIGMSAEELSRIFEPFSQGDHADAASGRDFGGLGLGLAICRNLIELHQGAITANSDGPGHGTTLAVELPLARNLAPAAPTTATPRAIAPTANESPASSGRLLLVEDHASTRLIMQRLLERRGFEVIAAGSVAEAKAAFALGPFVLLISDIGLPDGRGHEIMEALDDPNTIGIALTGYGMEEDLERTREAGFFAHLTKPVSIEALNETLNAVATARANQTDSR